jgi:sulfotransferase
MSKKIHYLGGLPRSGGTLLATLIGQHPGVYVSPQVPTFDIMASIQEMFFASEFNRRQVTPNRNPLLGGMVGFQQGFFSHVSEPVVIDRNKLWGGTLGMNLVLNNITTHPKVIFTVRDVLEILSSFTLQCRETPFFDNEMFESNFSSMKYLPLEDARCDFLMSSNSILTRTLGALSNAMQEHHKEHVLFVDYKDLVATPHEVMKKVYGFLELEPFENDFNNLKNNDKEDPTLTGHPKDFHKVHSKIERVSPHPKEILSKYVLNKYKDASFWKGKI